MSQDVEWMTDAACAETSPDTFFPNQSESTEPAKRICAGCPVAGQCLDYALANEFFDGVYGGLSPNQRRRLAGKSAPITLTLETRAESAETSRSEP